MDDNEYLLQISVNPLAFPPVLLATAGGAPDTMSPEPTPESLLEFLCAPDTDSSVPALVERYRKISNTPEPSFAPAVDRILDKLIWPLRCAKVSYLLGNYLGTVSHCGMVAEMLAILVFEIAKPKLNGQAMTEASQRQLFGSSFEKLRQQRRVSILRAYGVIDDAMKASFHRIRTARNQYLHQWSKDAGSLSTDALHCYEDAARIVNFVLGQTVRNGKVLLDPKLVRYLREQGVLVPSPAQE